MNNIALCLAEVFWNSKVMLTKTMKAMSMETGVWGQAFGFSVDT